MFPNNKLYNTNRPQTLTNQHQRKLKNSTQQSIEPNTRSGATTSPLPHHPHLPYPPAPIIIHPATPPFRALRPHPAAPRAPTRAALALRLINFFGLRYGCALNWRVADSPAAPDRAANVAGQMCARDVQWLAVCLCSMCVCVCARRSKAL